MVLPAGLSSEQVIEVLGDSYDLLNDSPIESDYVTLQPMSAVVVRRKF
jgi:hypothetical protein